MKDPCVIAKGTFGYSADALEPSGGGCANVFVRAIPAKMITGRKRRSGKFLVLVRPEFRP